MGQDNSTSVLLQLGSEVYNELEHFGAEQQVSVHHAAKVLLLQGFELWKAGKLNIEVTEKARDYYRRGQKQPRRKNRRLQK